MISKMISAVAVILPLVALCETWYPAEDWQDTPDPIASPLAKKGGTIRFNGGQGPKSFNYYVDSNTYTRMTFSLMYDPLITTDTETLDFAPSLARRWSISDDGSTFTFIIDENARWSDGKPITAEDVRWTFDQIMAPMSDTGPYKVILGYFEPPEILGERTIRFTKKGGSDPDWRDIINCGMFQIMPKHYFEGQDFNKLDLLNAPVSGPYQLTRIEEQVETEFSRVANWWKKDMPSCKYVCNFDKLVLRYYIDNENAFEAFKKRAIDVYPVYTARIMVRETNGEKFAKNWILKRWVTNHEPVGFQGFAMNMRRFPFDDLKVRQAMSYLIDREQMNRTMMYNAYKLLNSYFMDLYDEANPCPNEMYAYNFEKAAALLKEAGWEKNPKTGKLEKNGRPFKFVFLSRSGTEDKFLALFNASLIKLGIDMDIARKDFAGWMRDMDSFNYDMTWSSWGASIFRSPETMWKSSEADRKSSSNITGFKSEEVDEIIRAEKGMKTAAERNAAYKRIDKLIADQCPYAFLWMNTECRLLYWNKFGTPRTVLSKYSDEDCIFTYWWYDEDRARELADAITNKTCLPAIQQKIDYDTELNK